MIRKKEKQSLEEILQSIFTAQVLSLASQLRMEAFARGDTTKRDYENKAVQLVMNAREAVMTRWKLDLRE
jgi:hypothetical protein